MLIFSEYVKKTMGNADCGTSQRKFALKLGVSQAYISDMIAGLKIPSDDICIKMAEMNGDDPEIILLQVHAAKEAKNPKSSAVWDNLLKKIVNMSLSIPLFFNGFICILC